MNKRIEMLRSLDFDFYVGKGKFSASSSKNSKDWELAFGKLLEYKAKNGHCNVPTKTSPLGRWVANQRKKYKDWNQKNTSPSDANNKEVMRRFDQLEKNGFVFQLGRGNAKK